MSGTRTAARRRSTRTRAGGAVLALVLLVSACGSDGEGDDDAAATTTESTAAEPGGTTASSAAGEDGEEDEGDEGEEGEAAPAEVEPEQTDVSIGFLPAFYALPIFAARELGYFEEEGLNVELVNFNGGALIAQALAGGSIDFGANNVGELLPAAAGGNPLPCTVAATNGMEHTILADNDAGIEPGDWEGVSGKRVGVTSRGSGSEQLWRLLAAEQGFDAEGDTAIIAVGGVDTALAALQNDQVDLLVGYNPLTSIAVGSGEASEFLSVINGEGPDVVSEMLYTCVSTTPGMIEENPGTTQAVIRAVVRAHQTLQDDEDARVATATAMLPTLDAAVVEDVTGRMVDLWRPEISEEQMELTIDAYEGIDVVDADAATVEDVLIDPEFHALWDGG